MIVISTGFAPPTKQRCIESVRSQKNACFEHVIIDAAEQPVPLPAMQNLINAIDDLSEETIVVCVDLDDWLTHDRVLERVQQMHDAGAWVTYGSYAFSDGRPGHAAPYRTTDYRRAPWLASHLKTFRAGLFQRIQCLRDAMYKGDWLYRCVDLATMIPVMEMAGPDRITFCPDVLYTYNYANAFEFSATAAELEFEREVEKYIRGREPYRRIECI